MKKVLFLLMIFVAVLCITACNPFHTHTGNGEYTVAKEPTCTEDGESQMLCTECGEVAVTVPIPATGHKEVIIPAVEPTCTETGFTEGKYCIVCATILIKPSVVDIKHNFENFICSDCGEVYYSEGLEFRSNGDGTCIVVRRGTCRDAELSIPSISPSGEIVTGIDSAAFQSMSKFLTSVRIPDTVTNIGGSAFLDCSLLKSITIPNSVTTIENSVFLACSSLANITLPETITSIGVWSFANCDSLTSVIIPNSVTTVDYGAFSSCDSLTSVIIGNGVTSIADDTFYNCIKLTSIVIPDSVTSVGEGVFASCSSLTNISVSDGNINYKDIDGNLYTKDGKTLVQYANGKRDTSFAIPDSVISIGGAAFYNCDNLSTVLIPDSVTTIGDMAFYDCYSLTSVVIPDSVSSIGEYAFRYCLSLTSIKFNGTVEQWNDISFGENWRNGIPATEVICSDGVVPLN